MTMTPDLDIPAPIPQDYKEPLFNAPWEARAFAIVMELFQQQFYTWPEWVEYLSSEIATAATTGKQDQLYYEQWLTALENLLTAKGFISPNALQLKKEELMTEQFTHHHYHDSNLERWEA